MISIVCPCYNAQLFLPRIVKDVQSQTYLDWELIIVSNGLNQETQIAVAKSYAEKDSRISVVHTSQGGVSNARNLGVQQAKGEWVTFIDADDNLKEDHLQSLFDVATDGVDLIVGGQYFVYSDQQDLSLELPRLSSSDVGIASVLAELLKKSKLIDSPCNKLIRRSFLTAMGIEFDVNYSMGEDCKFSYQILLNAKSIETIPFCGYVHVNLGDSSSAIGRYHDNFLEQRVENGCLRAQLNLKAGKSQDEVQSQKELMPYFDYYFSVCNLFKTGCNFSFSQKVEIVSSYLEDSAFRSAFSNAKRLEKNMLLKLFDFAVPLGPRFTVLFFSLLYAVKRNLSIFRPFFMKFMRR